MGNLAELSVDESIYNPYGPRVQTCTVSFRCLIGTMLAIVIGMVVMLVTFDMKA